MKIKGKVGFASRESACAISSTACIKKGWLNLGHPALWYWPVRGYPETCSRLLFLWCSDSLCFFFCTLKLWRSGSESNWEKQEKSRETKGLECIPSNMKKQRTQQQRLCGGLRVHFYNIHFRVYLKGLVTISSERAHGECSVYWHRSSYYLYNLSEKKRWIVNEGDEICTGPPELPSKPTAAFLEHAVNQRQNQARHPPKGGDLGLEKIILTIRNVPKRTTGKRQVQGKAARDSGRETNKAGSIVQNGPRWEMQELLSKIASWARDPLGQTGKPTGAQWERAGQWPPLHQPNQRWERDTSPPFFLA